MNDNIIHKALECYIEKLENQNKTLKSFSAEIRDAFNCRGNRSNDDIINDILNTIRSYAEVFKED